MKSSIIAMMAIAGILSVTGGVVYLDSASDTAHAAMRSPTQFTSTISQSQVEFPTALAHLPTEPVGIGIFNSNVVFPQFSMDGKSTIAIYNTGTKTVNEYSVPTTVQNQFAYATASDAKNGTFWIGTKADLVEFNVLTHTVHTYTLPEVQYPYSTPRDHGASNILGLAIDSNGSIWMTRDHDSGVTVFDPKAGEFKQYGLPSGVVPKNIVILGNGNLAMNIWHSVNPQYMSDAGNLDTGVLIFNANVGRTKFVSGFAPTILDNNGRLLVPEGSRLIQIDPQSGVQSQEVQAPFSINPQIAAAPDGTTWWTTNGTILHVTNHEKVIYQIPKRVSNLSVPLTKGTPQPSSQPLNPDVSNITVAPDGTAWFVASGFNAIGYVKP